MATIMSSFITEGSRERRAELTRPRARANSDLQTLHAKDAIAARGQRFVGRGINQAGRPGISLFLQKLGVQYLVHLFADWLEVL